MNNSSFPVPRQRSVHWSTILFSKWQDDWQLNLWQNYQVWEWQPPPARLAADACNSRPLENRHLSSFSWQKRNNTRGEKAEEAEEKGWRRMGEMLEAAVRKARHQWGCIWIRNNVRGKGNERAREQKCTKLDTSQQHRPAIFEILMSRSTKQRCLDDLLTEILNQIHELQIGEKVSPKLVSSLGWLWKLTDGSLSKEFGPERKGNSLVIGKIWERLFVKRRSPGPKRLTSNQKKAFSQELLWLSSSSEKGLVVKNYKPIRGKRKEDRWKEAGGRTTNRCAEQRKKCEGNKNLIDVVGGLMTENSSAELGRRKTFFVVAERNSRWWWGGATQRPLLLVLRGLYIFWLSEQLSFAVFVILLRWENSGENKARSRWMWEYLSDCSELYHKIVVMMIWEMEKKKKKKWDGKSFREWKRFVSSHE